MGVSIISSNTTIKVSRTITSTTTVAASSYVEADYDYSSGAGSTFSAVVLPPIKRIFGPAATVPATISVIILNGASPITLTYTLISGVEFINSP